MELVGYARLHGVHSGEKFKDISVICLDKSTCLSREVIFSPEVHDVKEAFFLHYEDSFPLSAHSKGLVIEGHYSCGHVAPFKWPWDLKDAERKTLPWQVMGVPASSDGLYFKIHDEDLKKIKELTIKK